MNVEQTKDRYIVNTWPRDSTTMCVIIYRKYAIKLALTSPSWNSLIIQQTILIEELPQTMLSATSHTVLAKRMKLLSHMRRWNSTSIVSISSRAQHVPTSSTDVVTAKHTNHHKLLPLGNLRKPLTYDKHSPNDNRMYSSLIANNNMVLPSPRKKSHPSTTGNNYNIQHTIRTNFSYAGPRKLSDILRVELLNSKSSTEIVSY